MRLNKLLVVSTLAVPAAVAPISMTTSCANAWGHKVPISIGSILANNPNNPYYNFVKRTDLKDIDGLPIVSYLPSNYILDLQSSTNYEYATPIKTWYKTENNQSKKLPTDQWVNDTSAWYTPSSSFSTSITETVEYEGKKYNITQACAQNVTLTANTSFVVTIAQFINKYINYALSYATSQVYDNADFATAWGGAIPTTSSDALKNNLYEWMFANTNAHAISQTKAFLKSTSTNFNFDAETFPIVSYNDDKSVSAETRKLLTGISDSNLGDDAKKIYWSEKQEVGSGDEKYTVFTYPAVPVLINAKNFAQRWINPELSGSIFVQDYYQTNANNVIVDAVGTSWSNMNKIAGLSHGQKPTILKYDVNTNGKEVKPGTNADERLSRLNIKGSDFIAFITYSYVQWDKPNPTLNRNNTVTLSSLQTIMPAFLLNFKTDLFKKAKSDKDNSGYIVDVSKADKYSTELINLLSRNSDQGRIAKASDLSKESKEYLQFLTYMFAKDNVLNFEDFVQTTTL